MPAGDPDDHALSDASATHWARRTCRSFRAHTTRPRSAAAGGGTSATSALGGRVFIAGSGKLWAYDGADGHELYAVGTPSMPGAFLSHNRAPVPYGDAVFVMMQHSDGGALQNGIAKFAAGSGEFERLLPSSEQYPQVAIRGGLAFLPPPG